LWYLESASLPTTWFTREPTHELRIVLET
jgi:hypothetical protein